MILAHRIRLVPNKEQERYFLRACGVARFAYNWALTEWERLYALGQPRSELLLRRRLNGIKRSQFPWMLEVTKCAPQQAIKNLGRAYGRYVRAAAKAKRGEIPWKLVHKPRLKRRSANDSFRADNGSSNGRHHAVTISGRRVKLPLVGWVRMREELRFEGQIVSATVSRAADRWYVSVAVKMPDIQLPVCGSGVAGCDLGIKTLATIYDGLACRTVPAIRPFRALAARIRLLNKSLHRKRLGSANREKAKTKLARLHGLIRDKRQDVLHKLTTMLTRTYGVVAIEDLNPTGMIANRYLAGSVIDAAFGELRRQLAYKSQLYGSEIWIADRWYPSSKRCSACGHINGHVAIGAFLWECAMCRRNHERDENAARNLYLAASSAVEACGAEGSGRPLMTGETSCGEAGRSEIRTGTVKRSQV